MDVTAKVAFITGSAGDLGKGFAGALLEKGAKVYLNDIDEVKGQATLKEFQTKFGVNRVAFSVLDVTKAEQFEAVFNDAVKRFGQVDIMVNNAGVLSEINFELTVRVHLEGVIRGTRIAEKHMRKDNGGKGGRIINISSSISLGTYYCLPAYCAVKHGIRAFTSCLAQQPDKRAQGVEFATLCPDLTFVGLAKRVSGDTVEYLEDTAQACQTARLISLDDVVAGFMHLVQLEAITGAILLVDVNGLSFRRMDNVAMGTSFTPEELKPMPFYYKD